MRRVSGLAIAATLIILLVSAFWIYRVRAANAAAEFAPADTELLLIPAGTEIQASVRGGIVESATAGDTVTAFVLWPVVLNDKHVIPSGARLKGALDEVSFFGAKARVRMHFTALLNSAQVLPIHTRRVVAITPVRSDIEALGTAFRMLVGGSLGAAFGAGTGDPQLIHPGMLVGTSASEAGATEVPIRVILSQDLKVGQSRQY